MPRSRDPRDGLPEVLRSPMLADRLAAELEVAAAAVEGDGPMDRERRAFIASAALQVAGLGTARNTFDGGGQLAALQDANEEGVAELEYRGT